MLSCSLANEPFKWIISCPWCVWFVMEVTNTRSPALWEASGRHYWTALLFRLSSYLALPWPPDAWEPGTSLQRLWKQVVQVAFETAKSSLLSLRNSRESRITCTNSVHGNEESKTLVMQTIMSQSKGIYTADRALALSFECRKPCLCHQRILLDRNFFFFFLARVFS